MRLRTWIFIGLVTQLSAVSYSAQIKQAITVCIDPGHPSEVGIGTHGRRSTEVGVAFKAAKLLESRLISEGFKVVLTKQSELQRRTNRQRAEVANRSRASLFVRLHCDAASSSASGFAVYYPSRQGTSHGIKGPSKSVVQFSTECAARFYPAMARSLEGKLPALGLKTDLQTAIGSKQGALTGSIFSHVPTILIEMVVLTNPHDENWILSKQGMSDMVEALDQGVRAALQAPQSR